jgi:hypothetical protein
MGSRRRLVALLIMVQPGVFATLVKADMRCGYRRTVLFGWSCPLV